MLHVPIEALELSLVGAGSLGCSSKHLISKDVNVLVDVLVWQASGMKYDMGVGHTSKIRGAWQREILRALCKAGPGGQQHRGLGQSMKI